MPLLASSSVTPSPGPDPALAAIPSSFILPTGESACSDPDQRGAARSAPCDMGAFELVPIDTVAFNSNGGAAVASLSGPAGSSITLPSDTYPGYTFDGWFTQASGGTEVGGAGSSYTIPSDGITLYAQWTPIDTVAFNSNGGAAVASLSGPDGSSITLPSDTYPGYVFDGWFTQASGGTEVGGAGSSYTIPSDGITLYAHWTENTIDTVAFNSNGGVAVASLSGPDGSSITLPSDTYPGYSFDGWFTQASGGTKVGGAGSSYTITIGRHHPLRPVDTHRHRRLQPQWRRCGCFAERPRRQLDHPAIGHLSRLHASTAGSPKRAAAPRSAVPARPTRSPRTASPSTPTGPSNTVAFNSNGGAAVASLSGPDGSSITLPSDTYPGYASTAGSPKRAAAPRSAVPARPTRSPRTASPSTPSGQPSIPSPSTPMAALRLLR